jgi:hypothetical protein
MFFLLFLLDVRRIRIRICISDQWTGIRETKKHLDPTAPDRQHWLRQDGVGRCLEDPAPCPLDDGADLRLVKALEPVILRAVVLALRFSLLLLLGIRHRHLVLGLRQDEAHPLQPFPGLRSKNLQLFVTGFYPIFRIGFFHMGLPHKTDKINCFTLILILNFLNCFSTYPARVLFTRYPH